MLGNLTLVTGGASSGKSAFAERLVKLTGRRKTYLATAQAFDPEMAEKIAMHRAKRGPDWRTVEAPHELAPALADMDAGEVVLLDCATLWLTNHLLAESDLQAEEEALCAALESCAAPVVVVTNEVGQGLVPDNAMARGFRDAQGRLNQRLAAQADLVVAVMVGLPLVLKGVLPDGAT